MIRIVTFKWDKPGYRSKFEGWHVNVLKDMVKRNTTVPHEFICVTDNPAGIDPDVKVLPLWENPAPEYGSATRPNCFVRLRAFSPKIADLLGEKFIWMDLDTVICGNIDHILNDPADFKIWKVDNERSPCNGSLVLHKAGTRAEIWNKFSPSHVHPILGFRKSKNLIGSDQAWIAQHLRPDDQFFGQKDGVFSFRCHIKDVNGAEPPDGAKIIFFHGDYDPWLPEVRKKYKWIQKHYRLGE